MRLQATPLELSVTFPATAVGTERMNEALIVPFHELGAVALSALTHEDFSLWPIGRAALDFLRGASKFMGVDNPQLDADPKYTDVQVHTFRYEPSDAEEGLFIARQSDLFDGQYPVSDVTVEYEVKDGTGQLELAYGLDASLGIVGHPRYRSQYARLSAAADESEYALTVATGNITHAGILEPSEELSFEPLRDWRETLWSLQGIRVS